MRIDVLTLFPEIFSGYLSQSLLHKAIEKKTLQVCLHDLRRWSPDKVHHKVDDRPYGGGAGMIIMVEPVVTAVEAIQAEGAGPGHVVILSPQGVRLDQAAVERLAARPRVLLVCGRYEGFDERVFDILQPEEISIGDYILNGGEVAAMVIIDAVMRLVPGSLGNVTSAAGESFAGPARWLEFPQYTRPREFRGRAVPDVLLGGNHEEIARWRAAQSQARTLHRRGDLHKT